MELGSEIWINQRTVKDAGEAAHNWIAAVISNKVSCEHIFLYCGTSYVMFL